ncbi:gp152 [Bacillus phage G]|uniref:Gp152 n=1 Tax=Bacillus phage G TaxID=2884420 RepID=G3MBL8_9CAUD|nr:gp152 [Bacillus phage G]AEO93412.1 gp152 [Bacillus phage G]
MFTTISAVVGTVFQFYVASRVCVGIFKNVKNKLESNQVESESLDSKKVI